MSNFFSRNWERVAECRKPVIAAVVVYEIKGRCELAMMCDFKLPVTIHSLVNLKFYWGSFRELE